MILYRDFTTAQALDAEYNLNLTIPNILEVIGGWAQRSSAVRREMRCQEDIPFGPTPDEYLDVFPASQTDAPIVVFFYSGYWMAQSAKHASLVAPALNAAGVSVVVPNYSLCPRVGIDEIVRQARSAVTWTYRNAASLGFGNPERLYLCGQSAGGQLAMMCLMTDWVADYGLPERFINGVISISGIYDLRPLRYTYLQPKLQLTDEQIVRCSPLLRIDPRAQPLRLIYGGGETAEFRRQSDDFLAAWQAAGNYGDRVVVDAVDHFAVTDALFADADSAKPILEWIL